MNMSTPALTAVAIWVAMSPGNLFSIWRAVIRPGAWDESVMPSGCESVLAIS